MRLMPLRLAVALFVAVLLSVFVCSSCDSSGSSGNSHDGGSDVNHPAIGDVIFTEVMYDALALDDANGEWVELLNLTDKRLDLKGCFFADNRHQTEIDEDISIEPNGYLIFGIDGSRDHGNVTPDWTWGTYNLGNGGDSVILICDGEVIDEFTYAEDQMGYEPVKGASLALCPGFEDASANDDLDNWRFSTTEMPDGDRGTPREQNDPC